MVAVTGLGLAALVEHAIWAWACTAPVVRGDGARHAIFTVSRVREWMSGGPGPLSWLLEPLYYPTFTTVTAWPVIWAGLPGAPGVRASLALYTGVLVAGSSLAAWRVGGRRLGLAAGLAVLTVPLLWMLRTDVMLDVPLAALVAAFLAALPLAGAVRVRLWRSLLCGVVLAVGMLTKQAMPYLAAPALAWVGLPAVWRVLRQSSGIGTSAVVCAGVMLAVGLGGGLFLKGLGWPAVLWIGVVGVGLGWLAWRRRAAHLGELVGVGAVALVLAGPWYARSVGPILEGLRITRAAHADVPVGLDGLWRIIGMTPYTTHHLLPAPWAVALLVAVLALPWWVRRRPLLGPAFAAAVGGQLLISSFPDLHARHYAPLLAPLLVLGVGAWDALAAAVEGRRLGRGLRTVMLAVMVGHVGLMVASAWGGPRHAPVRAADRRIPAGFPPVDLAALGRLAVAPPRLLRAAAPRPDRMVLPLHQALRQVESDRKAQGVAQAGLLLVTQRIEVTGLVLAREAVGLSHLQIVEPPGQHGVQQARQRGLTVYTIELDLHRSAGRSASRTGWIDRQGAVPVVELPAEMAEEGGAGVLRVRRF